MVYWISFHEAIVLFKITFFWGILNDGFMQW
jgi:hypothetical protein